MDGGHSGNNVQQMVGAESQHLVLPVSEAVGVTVGLEEKINCVNGGDSHGGVNFRAIGGNEGNLNGKRKRGRPRKQKVVDVRTSVTELSPASPQKRGRGRPRGSGKWQTLAATLSGSALDTAGSNFTPHSMTIQTGENIVERISSFTQKVGESVCILSASGMISSAELLRPDSYGNILKYEKGRYEIVSLSGSYAHNGNGDANGKNCLLSVQLSNPDCALIGGAVGSSLIAGGPTQIILATFKQRPMEKAKLKNPNKIASSTPLQTTPNGQLPVAVESNGLQDISHVPARLIDAVEKFVNGHDNHISPQPFNWTSI